MANIANWSESWNGHSMAEVETFIKGQHTTEVGSDTLTTTATTLTGAVNELDGETDTLTQNVGTLSNLKTSVKTDLVSAINEVYGRAKAPISLLLENSSSPAWGSGDTIWTNDSKDTINAILNVGSDASEWNDPSVGGTFVIDSTHKKYARLNPTDHSVFVDGTAWFTKKTAAEVDAGTAGEFAPTWGEAFRMFPRVYYKVVGRRIYLSLIPITNDANEQYWEQDWIGNFKAYRDSDGKLHSRPYVIPTVSRAMSQFWADAQALGTEYGLVDYFDYCKLIAMHLVKFGNANSETTMGAGLQSAYTSEKTYWNEPTGRTIAPSSSRNGDMTGGYTYDGSHSQNKLFGIEALAGQTWEFRPNIRFSGTDAIVYKGNQVSNTISSTDADFVRKFTRLINSGWQSAMVLGKGCDFMPSVLGFSSSQYYCDYSYAAAGGELLYVGGSSYDGSNCGLSCLFSNDEFSVLHAYIGARLAFKGNINDYELVSGATLAALNA